MRFFYFVNGNLQEKAPISKESEIHALSRVVSSHDTVIIEIKVIKIGSVERKLVCDLEEILNNLTSNT